MVFNNKFIILYLIRIRTIFEASPPPREFDSFRNLIVAILRGAWFNALMLIIDIKANDKASRRTRNRIAEHGPQFDFTEQVGAGNGTGFTWLLRCSEHGSLCSCCSDRHEQWFGGLPRKEFDIVSVSLAMTRKEGHNTVGILKLM